MISLTMFLIVTSLVMLFSSSVRSSDLMEIPVKFVYFYSALSGLNHFNTLVYDGLRPSLLSSAPAGLYISGLSIELLWRGPYMSGVASLRSQISARSECDEAVLSIHNKIASLRSQTSARHKVPKQSYQLIIK